MSRWITAFRKARHEGPRIRQYKSLLGLDWNILDQKDWDSLPVHGDGQGFGFGSGSGDGKGAGRGRGFGNGKKRGTCWT